MSAPPPCAELMRSGFVTANDGAELAFSLWLPEGVGRNRERARLRGRCGFEQIISTSTILNLNLVDDVVKGKKLQPRRPSAFEVRLLSEHDAEERKKNTKQGGSLRER